jgi:hypothetical protein
MDQFFELSPTKDLHDDKTLVANFYVQAYSVTNFLVRKHSHLQFKEFCDQLRDGKIRGGRPAAGLSVPRRERFREALARLGAGPGQ